MECRSSDQNINTWCYENGVCEQTDYKWQRRIFEMAQAQQEARFAEETPVRLVTCGNVAVTVRTAGATFPEVMLTDFADTDRVYIACGYTDLRHGIEGLASLVQQQFNLDPFTNTLFLFCGRWRDRI